jgi:hypothetical protein
MAGRCPTTWVLGLVAPLIIEPADKELIVTTARSMHLYRGIAQPRTR